VIAGGEEAIAGYGRARNLQPEAPREDTIFEIGSITKVFTALLLAETAEAGLVGLDDPLEAHLPSGVSPPAGNARISLADLASHTGGLPCHPPGALGRVIRRPFHPFHALLDSYVQLAPADLYASLARIKLKTGAKARYSNLGAGLLGMILAERLGCSYGEALRDRILLPLGMRDTFAEVSDDGRGRMADGHTWRGKPQGREFEGPAVLGAGSLRSTAADMLRFLWANLEPPSNRLGSAIELTQRPRAKMGGRIQVGLGWLLGPVGRNRVRMLWHNGGTAGFRSFAGLVREAGAAVVVLGNANRSVDRLAISVLEQITQ
jgi:D-alanyl-D-alanine-carboxypeptidase/D-alanyl-D-alanine-endopeptidase